MPEIPDTKTYKVARLLTKAGFSVVPVHTDGTKRPALKEWKPLQERLPTEEELAAWFSNGSGLAVIAGRISGNLEILDFDERGLYEEFAQALIDHDCGHLLELFVIVETPRGGTHLYYRCEEPVTGNQKLARRLDEDGKPVVRIETRGEGGYALSPPSPDYKLVQGKPHEAPILTGDERKMLHRIARMFDLYDDPETVKIDAPPAKDKDPNRLRPGDDFNDRGDALEVLVKHGWRVLGRRGDTLTLQRPGKDGKGISATFNHAGSGYLYVFSTNAAPFESERAYSPYAVYTFLEHGGDFAAASSALGKEGYGEPAKKPAPKLRIKKKAAEEGQAQEEEQPAEPDGEMSEFELAEFWARENEQRFCYVEGDQWWIYENNHWHYSSSEVVTRSVQEFLEKTGKVTPARIRNVQFMAKSKVGPVSVSAFNAHPNWIPLANGVFDTATGELLPHDPAHKLTYITNYEYDPKADCPTWKQCLREWMIREDGQTCQEWVDLLQEWFGYCLIPDNRAQTSMLWNGEGGNGKGVATRMLEALVDREYTCALSIDNLHMEYTRAELHGKLVAFVNEPDPKALLKNGNYFKAIVGGDPIAARRPMEKVFTFVPVARIVISTNELPSTRDQSIGYYRRLLMIDWRYNVPQEKRDLDLDDKLKLELPGIFNWAIEGLRRFRERRKFDIPEESRKLLEGYKLTQDSIGRFVKEECFLDPLEYAAANQLYKQYKDWCTDLGMRAESDNTFGRRLAKIGCKADRKYVNGKQVRCWLGITGTQTTGEDEADEAGWKTA